MARRPQQWPSEKLRVLASQSQRGRVFFGLESQVGDAWVFVGVLGRCGRGHHRGGGSRFSRERSQGQPERRRGKHHVRRVRRQVRVQVVVRVRHGAVQLQLRLHLKGEGRHVAMTILRDARRGERGRTGVNLVQEGSIIHTWVYNVVVHICRSFEWVTGC